MTAGLTGYQCNCEIRYSIPLADLPGNGILIFNKKGKKKKRGLFLPLWCGFLGRWFGGYLLCCRFLSCSSHYKSTSYHFGYNLCYFFNI